MANKIKIARYRSNPYKVNYIGEGMRKPYVWSGSRGSKKDIKEIEEEVVDYLLMNSSCFNKGELVIVKDEKNPKAEEAIDNIDNLEQYENNTHTRAEIETILKSSLTKMKKELEKFTNKNEKKFVASVAKDIKLDSATKQKFLAEWTGMDKELLFGDE